MIAETMEAFCDPEGRDVEPLEGGTSRYMRLVERSARTMWSFIFCWRVTGGLLRLPVAVRRVHSPWPNAKTSPAESPAAARCGSSPKV